jgi:hypothetical protein
MDWLHYTVVLYTGCIRYEDLTGESVFGPLIDLKYNILR